MDLTGVDPHLILQVGMYVQHLPETNPTSLVSVRDLVERMGGWGYLADQMAEDAEDE